jgi:hypothetical protein
VETRWGPLTEPRTRYTDNEAILPSSFYPRRRFVNVVVENNGRAVATNCEVTLRLLEKTVGCQGYMVADVTAETGIAEVWIAG